MKKKKVKKKSRKKKILVLDLDETLIHSSLEKMPHSFKISNKLTFYASERPHVKKFMSVVSKWFRVVIMTASLQSYADPIIDRISKYGKVEKRYYRRDCSVISGLYVKDLDQVLADYNEKIQNIIIIDNSPISYMFQPQNALPCTSWYDDRKDNELLGLLDVLSALRYCDDVRSILAFRK